MTYKQPQWHQSLILALVCCGVGGLAYWLEFYQKPAKEKAHEESQKVFLAKDEKIKSFSIKNNTSGEVAISCMTPDGCSAKDSTEWSLTHPLSFPADSSVVQNALSHVFDLVSVQKISLEKETTEKKLALLKEYQLDSSSRQMSQKIEVEALGKKISLTVGASHPIEENFFVLKNDDENSVYLVSKVSLSFLNQSVTYWRKKTFFPLASLSIESFHVHSQTDDFIARKQGSMDWFLEKNKIRSVADPQKVQQFLSQSTYLTARDFVSEDKTSTPAKKILDHYQKILTLSFESSEEKTKSGEIQLLALKEKKEQKRKPVRHEQKEEKLSDLIVLTSLSPLIYSVDKSLQEKIMVSMNYFRFSHLLSSSEKDSLQAITFSRKGWPSSVTLNKKDGTWTLQDSVKKIKEEKVKSFLDQLTSVSIENFLNNKSSSPVSEALMVHLSFSSSDPAKKIKDKVFHFWISSKDKKVYSLETSSSSSEIFVLPSSLTDHLMWSMDSFLDSSSEPSAAAASGETKQDSLKTVPLEKSP